MSALVADKEELVKDNILNLTEGRMEEFQPQP